MWESFKMKIHRLRDQYIPNRINGDQKWRLKGAVPINEAARSVIKLKNKLHRQWIKALNTCEAEAIRKKYNTARNKVKNEIRNAKRKFEKSIAERAPNNPKMFWSHVRGKLKAISGVAPLLEDVTNKKSIKFDNQEKANILQQQFASVFSNEPVGELPTFEIKTNVSITDVQITEETVRKKIRNLDINKACGPDDIHPLMLVELNDSISAPLAMIFNKTMSTGKIPNDWKMAFVTAIYKKGPKNRPENYRPISLTSIICKLMETLIKDAVMKHVIENDLLSKCQHGFVPGRSTTTQLLSIYYYQVC